MKIYRVWYVLYDEEGRYSRGTISRYFRTLQSAERFMSEPREYDAGVAHLEEIEVQ